MSTPHHTTGRPSGGFFHARKEKPMQCPICGRDAARTVHYRRDRTWPESFSYCDSGHAWIVRIGAR